MPAETIRMRDEFIVALAAVRRNHPGWNARRIVAEALKMRPERFHVSGHLAARHLNGLLARLGFSSAGLSPQRFHLLLNLITLLGERNGLRKRAGKDGLLFRRDILCHILRTTRPAAFFYSREYARRIYYRYLREIIKLTDNG